MVVEPFGLILGFILGILLGMVLGLYVAPGRALRGGGLPLPTPPRDGQQYVTRGDLEHMELRLEDAYDKLHHLYDRTRKRLKVSESETAAPAPAPAGTEVPLTRAAVKAAIRERLRMRREGK